MKNALRISFIAIISVLMLSAAIAGGKKPAWVVNTEVKAKRSGDAIIGWGEYKKNTFGKTYYYVVAHGGYKETHFMTTEVAENGPFVKVFMSSQPDDYTFNDMVYCGIDGESHRIEANGRTEMWFLVDRPPCNELAREITNVFSRVLVDVALVDSMRVKK
jgi:hypothetical protein